MVTAIGIWDHPDTARILDLRRRVRDAMEVPPLAVREARAIECKLASLPLALRLRSCPTRTL
jgi:hypothetical protein